MTNQFMLHMSKPSGNVRPSSPSSRSITTGILVGIGETEADRVRALEAIAAAHGRHGHVQEVIVQNFLPKPGTAMRDSPPCPPEVHLAAVRLARDILPADVPVQAPPNLAEPDRLGDLLVEGITDWGGVSPSPPTT
jgi:FO synthase